MSQQCVVYSFQCGEEHKGTVFGNHLTEQLDLEPGDIAQNFRILRKCQNKFDCLIFEIKGTYECCAA